MRQLAKFGYLTFILVLGLLSLAYLSLAQETTSQACPTTTTEENKALAGRWVEHVLGTWDLDAVDTLLADTHVHHAGYGLDDIQGREDYKQYLSEVWATAFPEPQVTLEQVIGEGDVAVARWTIQALYQGGQGGTAPAGTEVTWTGISIFRIECGRIAETWVEADGLSRLQQIGAIPSSAEAGGQTGGEGDTGGGETGGGETGGG